MVPGQQHLSFMDIAKPVPRRLTDHVVRFNGDDIQTARKAWRCACGPVAIACILDLTLDDVRQYIGADYRGWMNPTQMKEALLRAGVSFRELDRNKLYRPTGPNQFGCPYAAKYGITRIQFAGPWTEPGVPERVAYNYTHWVASALDDRHYLDVHDNNWGWMSVVEYFHNMKKLAIEIPRASGAWWPTHCYEVEFPDSPVECW